MRILLWLGFAIIGGVCAMLLVGLLGYLLCLLIVRISGDQSRMQLMWLVYVAAALALHVAPIAILIAGARMEKRREHEHRESHGFQIDPSIRRKEND